MLVLDLRGRRLVRMARGRERTRTGICLVPRGVLGGVVMTLSWKIAVGSVSSVVWRANQWLPVTELCVSAGVTVTRDNKYSSRVIRDGANCPELPQTTSS